MSTQGPNLGINFNWLFGESGWHTQMDENLIAIDALIMISVKSATVTGPPGSPAEGDRYLIPSGATGLWGADVGKIARYHNSEWEFFTPASGWEVRADDSLQQYHYNGSTWSLIGSRLPQHANNSAASSGGVPVGGVYINSSSGALTVRLS